jgi:hypothetical protein
MGSLESVADDAGLTADALIHIFNGEGIRHGDIRGFYGWMASDPIWSDAWAALCDDMVPPALPADLCDA